MLDDLTQARTYALADLDDGFEVLRDLTIELESEKNDAFDQQHALVENYFQRAITDSKNVYDLLDEMNVHYLSGITIDPNGLTASRIAVDQSVYDDCFDHIVYDVGHLPQYSPIEN